jgi:hypothetical protein
LKNSKLAKTVFLSTVVSSFLVASENVCSVAQAWKNQKSSYKTLEEARLNIKVKGGAHIALKAPNNFPLPVYASNIISTNFTNTTTGLPMADLTLVTKDDAKTVFEWYKSQCSGSGWQVRMPKQSAMTPKEKAGRLFLLNAVRGDQQSNISISSGTKHPETIVNIVWMKHT